MPMLMLFEFSGGRSPKNLKEIAAGGYWECKNGQFNVVISRGNQALTSLMIGLLNEFWFFQVFSESMYSE